jgi:hypothetical protein
VYAAHSIAPDQMFNVSGWNSDEWINYGTLMLGLLLRITFMAGIGRE